MAAGLLCEDCEQSVWLATTLGEVRWIQMRERMVREVAAHLQSGLDSWMDDALTFLDAHGDHSVLTRERS